MLTLAALTLVLALGLAACGAAAAPSPSPSAGPTATPRPTPTAVPGDGGQGGGTTDPGSGGGSGGSGGGGAPIPGGGFPGGGANDNPLFGNASYLQPSQGLVNPRTVNVQLVRAVVNADGTATADVRWWSGVAPCSMLDHVEMTRDDTTRTIHLKVVEGSAKGDVACIEIAQLNATLVDLGKLASGTWTISAEGDAPAIPLDVP